MASRNMLPDLWRSERGVWNPMREMSRLQRRIDRVFEELFTEPSSSQIGPGVEAEFIPPCDVEETKTHYLMTFDLPGVKKNDVKIELQDNQLIVSGERKEEKKEETQGRVSRERYYGSFSRSFTLPSAVNAEKVDARYENGILQIAIPKSEISVGKQIPVKEGNLIESKGGKAA